jgi:DNA-binding response OmpR family regulator
MAKKILSIDDEPALLNLFQVALGHKGYQVLTADNVEDGLRIAEQHDFALIMLDMRMRGESGLAAYTELRRRQQTPVLFVTGDPSALTENSGADPDQWRREIKEGNAAILLKPFDIQTLYDRVEALINRVRPTIL